MVKKEQVPDFSYDDEDLGEVWDQLVGDEDVIDSDEEDDFVGMPRRVGAATPTIEDPVPFPEQNLPQTITVPQPSASPEPVSPLSSSPPQQRSSRGFVVLSRNKNDGASRPTSAPPPTAITIATRRDQDPQGGSSSCSGTSSEGSPIETTHAGTGVFRRGSFSEHASNLFKTSPTSAIGLGLGSLRSKGSKVFSTGSGSRRGSISASVTSGGTTSRRGSATTQNTQTQDTHSRNGSAGGSSAIKKSVMADMDKWYEPYSPIHISDF